MLKLWQKLIIKDLLKFMLSFLVGVFIIYFIVDFSFNGSKLFHKNDVNIFKIIIYYYHNFVAYLNLFLSLAFLFSIIKVIYIKNHNNELIALQMAGISKFKLTLPIFIIAFFLMIFSYLNYEYLTPTSAKAIANFKSTYLKSKKNNSTTPSINTLLLNDATKLIYQNYNFSKKEFFDLFWIVSLDDIWHIKYLNVSSKTTGKFVDHFTRNDSGALIKKESFPSYEFDKMDFEDISTTSLYPVESRSISTLHSQIKNKQFSSKKEKAHILSYLNYKLAMPLIPLLLPLALIPFCLRFSRNSRIYIIIFGALISFIAFYIFMDSMIILAQNSVGPCFLIIWLPIILLFSLFGLKFLKKI